MKKLAVMALLVGQLLAAGCGSSSSNSSSGNAAAVTSGLWGAVLAGGSGDASGAVLGFITQFTVNGDGSLGVSEFSFNNIQPCFVTATESGSSTLTTNSSGVVTGPITLVVTSTSPAGNILTLTGQEQSSTSITGSWTLAGTTGCNGTGGSFTMTKS